MKTVFTRFAVLLATAAALVVSVPVHAQSAAAATSSFNRNVEMQGLTKQLQQLEAEVTSATTRLFKIKECHRQGYLFRTLNSTGEEGCKSVIPCQSPFGDGSIIGVGESIIAYQSPTVPYGNTCLSQVRTCDESTGIITGTFTQSNCAVTPAAGCNLPWGGTLASGQSVTAYSSSSSNCTTTQTRTCTNGTLSGSYQYGSCSTTCNLPWGGTINQGQCVDAYAAPTVPYGQSCSKVNRCCYANGVLSDAYNYPSCSVLGKFASCITYCDWAALYGWGTCEEGAAAGVYMCSSPPAGASCFFYAAGNAYYCQ